MSDFAEALENAVTSLRGSNPNLGRATSPSLVRPSAAAGDDQSPTLAPVGTPPPGSLIPENARTGARITRTSWHSKDPKKAVQGLIDRTRQELGLDNVELAVSCAESRSKSRTR